MSKVAFVFPGQGAQYVGMGKDFYEQIPVSRKVYTIASEVTGLNLPGLCFKEKSRLISRNIRRSPCWRRRRRCWRLYRKRV